MINYIRADIYRSLNKVSFWIYTAVLAAISVLFTICLFNIAREVPELDLGLIRNVAHQGFMIPVFLVIAFIEMVTGDEQRNKTLKNVVSFGITRNTIVISKIISTVLLSILSAFIILTIFSVSVLMLLNGDKNVLFEFITRFLLSSVLWIGAISIGTFISLVFDSSNMSSVIYIFIFLMSKNIITLLTYLVSDKFSYLYKILISTRLAVLAEQPLIMSNVAPAILVGVTYTIVFTGLSMLYLRHKEIK